MNWLQTLIKRASVTFALDQAYKISQPKTTFDISWMMLNWAGQNVPNNIINSPETITIDGYDTSQYIGTINWYVLEGVNPDDIKMYAEQYIREELMPLGIKAHVDRLEQSGMYKYKVWRIEVTENSTQDLTEIPEMNIANHSAKLLLGLLNIPFDWAGSISLIDLKNRLDRVTQIGMREFTEDPKDTKVSPEQLEDIISPPPPAEGLDEYVKDPIQDTIDALHETEDDENKMRMISQGYDIDRLQRYINRMKQIVDFGLQHGFKNIQWA